MQIQEINVSPYEFVLKEVEEGKVNPFDVDVEYLIELFKEKAKDLQGHKFFIEAGIFILAASKLLKLQVQTIFPEPKKERRKITIEEVKEVIEEVEEEIASDTLDWLYDYSPHVGRPKGSIKAEKPKILKPSSLREFLPLHKSQEVDWSEEAKRVYEEIKEGTFKIRSWIDLIAFLYAYMEYDFLQIEFEKLL